MVNCIKESDLRIVGSTARGEVPHDLDIVTVINLDRILKRLKKKFDVKVIRKGEKYLQVKINKKLYDFWKVEKKYFNNNIKLRTMDKGHLIAFKKELKKLGYKLNFNGIFKDDKYITFNKIFSLYPELKNKFKKYL